MTFGFKVSGQSKKDQLEDVWRRNQCVSCPLLPPGKDPYTLHIPKPGQYDVLIVNSIESQPITHHVHPRTFMQIDALECTSPNLVPGQQERLCCFGRKLKILTESKPKVVIAVGYQAYAEFETMAGFECDIEAKYIPLPTKINGHTFWLIQLPDYGVGQNYNITRFKKALDFALANPAEVVPGNWDGVEYITTPGQMSAAFDDLEKLDLCSSDWETNGLRPFFKDRKILTAALGTYERTFAIPVMHPQTPTLLKPAEFFNRLWVLSRRVKMLAFNAAFEQLWASMFLGIEFILGKDYWEDAMAQAFVMRTGKVSLSLENCGRRVLGVNIKAMTNIDVANLENTPLEKVLEYNAPDTKYTDLLYRRQALVIEEQGLQQIYRRRLENVRGNVPLEKRGLDLNIPFIEEQRNRLINLADEYQTQFHEIEEVRLYEAKFGRIKVSARLDKLFHGFCDVDKSVTSFDDEFLKNFNHPISKVIADYRGESKLLSTYIEPLIIDARRQVPWKHKKTVCKVMEDGRIHTSFNALRTATGRLASGNPNVQNFPSRGGNKYLRNVVTAPPGYVMVAMDYAQIEARVIASLAKDVKFMQAIWDNYDTHMYWTEKIMKQFKGTFVPLDLVEEDLKKKKKAFRGEIKNTWTFPLLYNSANKSIWEALTLLTLPGADLPSEYGVNQVIKDFWEHYPQIKAWQDSLTVLMERNGEIITPFGQPMRDLQKTEYCNYSSQSAASDITTTAQNRIIELGIKMGGKKFYVVINIHDDLTLLIKEECVDEVLAEVIPIMVDTSHIKDWYLVPLDTEVSMGQTWGALKELGVFSSREFAA